MLTRRSLQWGVLALAAIGVYAGLLVFAWTVRLAPPDGRRLLIGGRLALQLLVHAARETGSRHHFTTFVLDQQDLANTRETQQATRFGVFIDQFVVAFVGKRLHP